MLAHFYAIVLRIQTLSIKTVILLGYSYINYLAIQCIYGTYYRLVLVGAKNIGRRWAVKDGGGRKVQKRRNPDKGQDF